MLTITLKNIPDELHRRLREIAARHHRSLNKEIIAQLEAGVLGRGEGNLATELDALHRELPEIDHALVDGFKRQGRP